MSDRFRFGVLSTAKIGVDKVIPEMMESDQVEVTAIASRDESRAKASAGELGIERAYGSYEALLADPDIDGIYNPLPNHLHVPWSIKAAEAGKHVLCEKPIAITRAAALPLIDAADDNNVLIQEAFMVVTHPQWLKAKAMIDEGAIGELRAIQGAFCYFNKDAANIRNMADIGGGGMLDIGCYPTVISRFITGREPDQVFAVMDRDPDFGTDRLGSVMLRFGAEADQFPVQSSFVFSTQISPFQRMSFLGTKGRLEVPLPFNALADRDMEVWLDTGKTAPVASHEVTKIPTCGQYQLAGEAFAAAARGERATAVPLPWTMANMAVIDAAFKAAESGQWERPETDA